MMRLRGGGGGGGVSYHNIYVICNFLEKMKAFTNVGQEHCVFRFFVHQEHLQYTLLFVMYVFLYSPEPSMLLT